MLNSKKLNTKTFEDRYNEALLQIPLYTDEWTNFNPSDPGITILETLSAFETLQADQMEQVTPQILQNLLKLVGFRAKKGACARVLLAAEQVKETIYLPENQQFWIGDICFETNRVTTLAPGALTGIYGLRDGTCFDYSFLCEKELRVPGFLFGEHPKAGDSVCFVANAMPEAGEELILHVTVADRYNRNAFPKNGENTFAELRWECYTENGFVQLNSKDGSNCFLTSGEIRLRMPQLSPSVYSELPQEGYVIRATLVRADYDVRPKLVNVQGFLFEVYQKQTRSICASFHGSSQARLFCDLAEEGYVQVFAREEKGGSYRKYEYAPAPDAHGRYYELQKEGYGMHIYRFDRKRYGYAPLKGKNAIRIVAYTPEAMRAYVIGTVLGYDDQVLKLPFAHVASDSFSIVAEREDENGEKFYDFLCPGRSGNGKLCYHLSESEGTIRILDAGNFIGAQLYLGACCTTDGAFGNIRAGSVLTTAHVPKEVRFTNPGAGVGGCFREGIPQVRERFLKDLHTPYTAVTAQDYEQIVKATPQLCIHKVRAYVNDADNCVRIAVKPGTDEEFPKLSDIYREVIMKELDGRRLLGTRIELVQPVYEPVNVRGTIYVKPTFENCSAQIEQAIRTCIDDIHSERSFGQVLKFNEVFQAVESLECVEFVYDLALQPQHASLAKLKDADIYPVENCLLYPGELSIEVDVFIASGSM